MQSQLTKNNKMFLPEAVICEPDFCFYNKGKEMWKASYEIRDEMEDTFRHQLEKADLM